MSSVVQSWLAECCSWKEQTVLLTAMRGCDGAQKNDKSKDLLHNYRATILNDADPSTGFMQQRTFDMEDFCNNLDQYPMHFLMHFIHAVGVIGYCHPDEYVADKWLIVYQCLVAALHLHPETKREMRVRLKDKN